MTTCWLPDPSAPYYPDMLPGGKLVYRCVLCPETEIPTRADFLAHHAWHVANSSPTVQAQGSGIA